MDAETYLLNQLLANDNGADRDDELDDGMDGDQDYSGYRGTGYIPYDPEARLDDGMDDLREAA